MSATERVLAAIGNGEVWGAAELAEAGSCSKSRLNELAKAGVIKKVGRGRYASVHTEVPEFTPEIQRRARSRRTKKFEPVSGPEDPRLQGESEHEGVELSIRGEGRDRFNYRGPTLNDSTAFDCYGGQRDPGGVRSFRTFRYDRITGIYEGNKRKLKPTPHKMLPGRHKAGRR